MLTALLQALVEPARQLGVPALPQHLLDLVAPTRVAGRRAWANDGRAAIELRSWDPPDVERLHARVVSALERHPAVAWAAVNAPLARVIVGLRNPTVSLAELVAVIDREERERSAGADHTSPASGIDTPFETAGARRAAGLLAADAAGLALAAVGPITGLGALPAELAGLVTAVDTVPRLRATVEGLLGRSTADTAIALVNAGAQGLARGVLGLGVDAAYRILQWREASANAGAWRRQQDVLFAGPDRVATGPLQNQHRPVPLNQGPIESWGDAAGAASLGTVALAVPATGSLQRAAGLAVAALPKAGRLGRDGFVTELARGWLAGTR